MERKPDRMDATKPDLTKPDLTKPDLTKPSLGTAARSTRMVGDTEAPSSEPHSGSEGIVADLSRELTRRERLVVMLRYTEELTVAEIAAVLEIAVTEVERMLESIAERVRRRIRPRNAPQPAPTYGSIRGTFA